MNTCWVNESNPLWQRCRCFMARGFLLSSVAWEAYDLGFHQLCPCVRGSREVVTKANERSRRKKSADSRSCWNTARQEVKAAAPSGLSLVPFPALVSSPLPLLPPPASSLPSSPSLTFSPFLFFPSSSSFPFFHTIPGWLQVLPQAWSINLDPALATLYFWIHPPKSVICFSPRPQLKRQESYVAFVCPTWRSQQAQWTKLIRHIK